MGLQTLKKIQSEKQDSTNLERRNAYGKDAFHIFLPCKSMTPLPKYGFNLSYLALSDQTCKVLLQYAEHPYVSGTSNT